MDSVEKYENRIVVFIDVLGFSNLIKNTVDSKESTNSKRAKHDNFNNIKSALSIVREKIENFINEKNEKFLSLSQFSDSIVISICEDSNILVDIMKLLREIQMLLLYHNKILIRGGVVKGLLIHTEKFLFGPAMINAHLLESKCALSPRIIVMPDVKKRFDEIVKLNQIDNKTKILCKDYDGTFYVNYFTYNKGDECLFKADLYFREVCLIIKKNITRKDVSLKLKYYWMRDKLKHSNIYNDYKNIYHEVLYSNNKKSISNDEQS